MRQSLLFLKKQWSLIRQEEKVYKKLRAHMNTLPVGFPKTFSGVELRILEALFEPGEAKTALALTHRFESADTIMARGEKAGISGETVEKHLASMEEKGLIHAKTKNGETCYALLPYVIGSFEMQLNRLTPGLYLNTRRYFMEAYALEYMSTKPTQTRIIPIEKSISSGHKVSTYDEIRTLIKEADGRIAIAECICKKGKDIMEDPCKRTNRRETCIILRDFHDTVIKHGWGRSISTEEAFEIIEKGQKEGLVLQPSNDKNPQFVCMCCSCCCGILEMLSVVPHPVDFVTSNYLAKVDENACSGCGVCVRRCHMHAISLVEEKAVLDPKRCIGCGICVPTCKEKAISMQEKENQSVPAEDFDTLYEEIAKNKKSTMQKISHGIKGVLGMEVKT